MATAALAESAATHRDPCAAWLSRACGAARSAVTPHARPVSLLVPLVRDRPRGSRSIATTILKAATTRDQPRRQVPPVRCDPRNSISLSGDSPSDARHEPGPGSRSTAGLGAQSIGARYGIASFHAHTHSDPVPISQIARFRVTSRDGVRRRALAFMVHGSPPLTAPLVLPPGWSTRPDGGRRRARGSPPVSECGRGALRRSGGAPCSAKGPELLGCACQSRT